MSQYGESWVVYNKHPQMFQRAGDLRVFWLEHAPPRNDPDDLEIQDMLRRIIACVNFCEGVSTDDLESAQGVEATHTGGQVISGWKK